MEKIKRLLAKKIIIAPDTKKKIKKFSLISFAVIYVLVTLPLLVMFIVMWMYTDPY